MTSLQECLFNSILNNTDNNKPVIKFGFFEIHFKKCYDLLNQREECKLQTGSNGLVSVSNNIHEVKDFNEYLELIQEGLKYRKTLSTERNDISSRSHAIMNVYLTFGNDTRCITMIDLAGNERN